MRKTEALQELQSIPGVGISIAQDLLALGYRKVSDLRGEDPQAMYDRSCKLQNAKIDRCLSTSIAALSILRRSRIQSQSC